MITLIKKKGYSLKTKEVIYFPQWTRQAVVTETQMAKRMARGSTFSVGEIVLAFNIFILGAAGFIFGWDKAMYSLVAYFVISKMIDVVIKGLDESYAVMIVSDESQEIADALMSRLGRGVTFIKGMGAYTGDPKRVIYCVVTRLEVDKLKEIAIDKDENAFITINPVHDIVGGRFKKKSIHLP